MKFPHIIGRREIVRAALLGSITGIVGVLLFILILNSMNSTYTEQKHQNELIPVSSQQTEENEEDWVYTEVIVGDPAEEFEDAEFRERRFRKGRGRCGISLNSSRRFRKGRGRCGISRNRPATSRKV